MSSRWSDRWRSLGRRREVFCDEPWLGLFSIETNLDVTFCPCYLQMKLGNLNESPLPDLWNAPQLVALRRSFADGRLPRVCSGQLCSVATEAERGRRFVGRRLLLTTGRPLLRLLRSTRKTLRRARLRFV